MSKLLGIDYGEKHVGLALADSQARLASPLKVIDNKGDKEIIQALQKIISDEEIDQLVVGLPKGMKNQANEQLKIVNNFIQLLEDNFQISVVAEDEKLTTAMAGSLIKEQKKKGDRDDAVAAMLILQGYLDKK